MTTPAPATPTSSKRRTLIGLLLLVVLISTIVIQLISQLDTRLRLSKPDGFAEVDEESRSRLFVQKLIAPDGTVIAVRRFDNPDEKTGLDYWGEALELEKTLKDGMVLVSRQELTTTKGEKGLLFDFEVGERPSHIRYMIALFVMGDVIYTVEAGGDPKAITERRDTIVSTMKTLGE